MSELSGSVEVAVIRKTPTPVQVTDERLADLVSHALIEEQVSGDWQVAIAFVDSMEMRMLHQQFMNDPSATDILTFAYDEPGVSGGDIAICVGVAEAQREEYGKTLEEELYFLALHGILHLVGHVDTSEAERAAMLARQEELLEPWMRSIADQG